MNQLLLMPSPDRESEAVSLYPSVSIIMSFEPKMKSKRELSVSLNNSVVKAEQELLENFDLEMAMLVIQKLNSIIKDLDYSTHKKSIAIYVSSAFEKILYLDMEVEERVIVDNSFAIRELIESKKEIHQYLLLVLNEKESKMYFDNNENLLQVFASRAEFIEPGDNQPGDNGELGLFEKYLRHIDAVLDIIISSFKAPLFVLGNKRIIEQFKNITKHASSIIQYVEDGNENTSPQELKMVMHPLINNWPKVKKENLRLQLKNAFDEKKVVTGIEDVFRKAMRHQGHLLLVEKNYKYPAGYSTDKELIDKAMQSYSQFSYIQDAVDDIIEKVLEENGDVEFVDKEVLIGYDHIALIQ